MFSPCSVRVQRRSTEEIIRSANIGNVCLVELTASRMSYFVGRSRTNDRDVFSISPPLRSLVTDTVTSGHAVSG